MKQLTLEETNLKEEMKLSCYENDLDMFKMLCHLENFEIQYWELDKQNHELKRTIKINERSRRRMQQSLVKKISELEHQCKRQKEVIDKIINIINYYGVDKEHNDDVILRHIFKNMLDILKEVSE